MSVMAVRPPTPPPPDPWLFPAPGPDGFTVDDLADLSDEGGQAEIIDGTLLVSRPGGFTVDDLDRIPGGDGNRYELIDGMLVVSPAPGMPHQVVVTRLATLLTAACPRDLFVLGSSPAVRTGRRGSVEPDVVVLRKADVAAAFDRPYTGVPVLAVEVLSPSSRTFDRLVKRSVYARIGVPTYWIIDPSPRTGPAITALRLDPGTGEYHEVAAVGPDGVLTTAEPFSVTLRLSDLHDLG
jgi:Uma2 family endonuclease